MRQANVHPRPGTFTSIDISKDRLHLIANVLCFRLTLDVVYFLYMHTAFGMHFLTPMPINFSLSQYLMSIAFALVPTFFVSHRNNNFSGIFFLVVMVFTYLPITCMYGFDYRKSPVLLFYTLLAIFVSFVVSEFRIKRIRIPVVANGEKIAIGISVAFLALFVANSVMSGAIARLNFDIARVYEFRVDASELLDSGVLAYTNLWAQKVFNPLLFCIALYRRNVPLLVATVGVQVFFFAITHHRSHLFVPLAIYFITLVYTRNIAIKTFYLIASFLMMLFLLVGLYFNLDTLMSLLLRRIFFVPASVSFDWIDYFSTRPMILWTDKLLSFGSDTIYTSSSVVRMIGDFMAPGKQLNFNSGIVSTGYAQAGVLGVVFYAAVFGVFVKFLNALIRSGVPAFFCAGILGNPFNNGWSSSDLFATLLSHGIIVGTIMLWFIGTPKVGTSK